MCDIDGTARLLGGGGGGGDGNADAQRVGSYPTAANAFGGGSGGTIWLTLAGADTVLAPTAG